MSQPRMRWIDAECVQNDDIVMRKGTVVRILHIERPYAVIREYEDGEFGPRKIIALKGDFFQPAASFLMESGVYESDLMKKIDSTSPEQPEQDLEQAIKDERVSDDPMFLLNIDEP